MKYLHASIIRNVGYVHQNHVARFLLPLVIPVLLVLSSCFHLWFDKKGCSNFGYFSIYTGILDYTLGFISPNPKPKFLFRHLFNAQFKLPRQDISEGSCFVWRVVVSQFFQPLLLTWHQQKTCPFAQLSVWPSPEMENSFGHMLKVLRKRIFLQASPCEGSFAKSCTLPASRVKSVPSGSCHSSPGGLTWCFSISAVFKIQRPELSCCLGSPAEFPDTKTLSG